MGTAKVLKETGRNRQKERDRQRECVCVWERERERESERERDTPESKLTPELYEWIKVYLISISI